MVISIIHCTDIELAEYKTLFGVIAGDLENEEEILEWLVSQLEKDEIEDITDEMLDRLIKDGKTLAVLFCKCKIHEIFVLRYLFYMWLN